MKPMHKAMLPFLMLPLLQSCAQLQSAAQAALNPAPVNICPLWVKRPPLLADNETLVLQTGDCPACTYTLARQWVDYANTLNDDFSSFCPDR